MTAHTGPGPRPGPRRILVVGTGSLSAADLPTWMDWLRTCHPDTEVRLVLTRSACRFVSPTSLSLRLGVPVEIDEWDTDPGCPARAVHVDWQQWAQAVLVYPATFAFLARYSMGLADSPAMLALQCTGAPVVLAPSLPPGGLDSAAFAEHWRRLQERPGVAVAAPRPGRSATTGEQDAAVPAPFVEAFEMLTELWRERSDPASSAASVSGAGSAAAPGPGSGPGAVELPHQPDRHRPPGVDAVPDPLEVPADRPGFPSVLGVPR